MVGFEWDSRKAATNAIKHGIEFADAVHVLEDDRAITIPGDSHIEQRWVTTGSDSLGRVLTVVYTWRTNNVRLISARKATPNERSQYWEDS